MASKRLKPSDGIVDGREAASQRVDKWLVFARIVKTRSIAQHLVESKKVRLNKEKIDNPARNVRVGDVLTISYSSRVLVLKVADFAERRGSPAHAQTLYEDLSKPFEAGTGADDHGDANPSASSFEGVFDRVARDRRDPVQRDKDRRTARKERQRRDSV